MFQDMFRLAGDRAMAAQQAKICVGCQQQMRLPVLLRGVPSMRFRIPDIRCRDRAAARNKFVARRRAVARYRWRTSGIVSRP